MSSEVTDNSALDDFSDTSEFNAEHVQTQVSALQDDLRQIIEQDAPFEKRSEAIKQATIKQMYEQGLGDHIAGALTPFLRDAIERQDEALFNRIDHTFASSILYRDNEIALAELMQEMTPEQCNFILAQRTGQKAWRTMFKSEDEKVSERAKHVLVDYVESKGLDKKSLLRAWGQSSWEVLDEDGEKYILGKYYNPRREKAAAEYKELMEKAGNDPDFPLLPASPKDEQEARRREYLWARMTRDIAGENTITRVAMDNVAAIELLERLEPGITSWLQRRNKIQNFARFVDLSESEGKPFLSDMNVLVKQYRNGLEEEKNKKKKPARRLYHVLVDYDYNNASKAPYFMHEIDKEAERNNLQLEIAEAGSVYGLCRRIIDLYNRNGPISKMILTMHGNEQGFAVHEEQEVSLADIKKLLSSTDPKVVACRETLRSCFSSNACITLCSCVTGKDNGIATQLSRLLGVPVVSAYDSENGSSLAYLSINGKNGDMWGYYNGAKTRVHFPNRLSQMKWFGRKFLRELKRLATLDF